MRSSVPLVLCLLLVGLLVLPGCATRSREARPDFPVRPITIIIPFSAGGANDMMSRPMVPLAEELLGQPIAITLMPGASGMVGTRELLNRPADGYTVLFVTEGPLTVLPIVAGVPYERSDFIPICQLNTTGMVIVTGANSPWNTMQEALADIKNNPGRYIFATAGTYSTPHMSMLAMEKQLGIQFRHLPFDGGGAANVAIAAGDAHLGAPNYAVMRPLLEAGRVRALAVTSSERMPELPDTPTLLELGMKNAVEPWRGFFVRAGTPEPIVQILRERFARLILDPRYMAALADMGERVVYLDGPEFKDSWDVGFRFWAESLR